MWVILTAFLRPSATAAGDTLFEAFFRRHYPQVLGFFKRRGCSPDERHDLVQETFLRAFRGFPEFRGEAKPTTWLLTIASNLWRNRQRAGMAGKRAAEEVPLRVGEPGEPAAEDRPEEALLTGERRLLLLTAIDRLPAKMRRCVLLRVYHEMSYRDIAALLDVSESTAKSQVSRARRLLLGHLAECYPELGARRAREG